MKDQKKLLMKFLKTNHEFAKVRVEGKQLVVRLAGSAFDYKVEDFSSSSSIRRKLELLETELKLPAS